MQAEELKERMQEFLQMAKSLKERDGKVASFAFLFSAGRKVGILPTSRVKKDELLPLLKKLVIELQVNAIIMVAEAWFRIGKKDEVLGERYIPPSKAPHGEMIVVSGMTPNLSCGLAYNLETKEEIWTDELLSRWNPWAEVA